ncbi:MAG: sulfate transporter CysZ [Pontibacterium sp.]
MKGNPIRGAGYLAKGVSYLPEPSVRPFIIVPLIVNIFLFSGAIWLLLDQFDYLMELSLGVLPSWLSWLSVLLYPVFAVGIVLMVYYTFTLVANFIAAPFNGLLSEVVERNLRGETVSSDGWKELVALIPRSIGRELAKLAYFIPRFLLILVISFIPVINVIAPFLWFAFGAWMMAIQYCDYPMDNNKVSFKDMKLLLKQQRLTSLGFGVFVQLLMMIPLVNLLVMPAAVVGATFYWVDEYAENVAEA